MKILITTNTFGEYNRQTVGIQSLKKLKEEFPDIIDIINIQFQDEKETFINCKRRTYGNPIKLGTARSV